MINTLKNYKQTFDKNDIINYQLLLIKLFTISLNLEDFKSERVKLNNSLLDLLNSCELKKNLIIDDLNILFNLDEKNLNIDDKNLYIILFNIIYEEWQDFENNNLSDHIKNIISMIISKIENMESITSSPIIEKENFLFEDNFIIKNKQYLREYIIQKNLIPYECNICGLTAWQNNPLMLHLHSQTGIYTNTNLKDLEFLCPNCYSQIGD